MFALKNQDDLIKSAIDAIKSNDLVAFNDVLSKNKTLRLSTVASYAGKTFLKLVIESVERLSQSGLDLDELAVRYLEKPIEGSKNIGEKQFYDIISNFDADSKISRMIFGKYKDRLLPLFDNDSSVKSVVSHVVNMGSFGSQSWFGVNHCAYLSKVLDVLIEEKGFKSSDLNDLLSQTIITHSQSKFNLKNALKSSNSIRSSFLIELFIDYNLKINEEDFPIIDHTIVSLIKDTQIFNNVDILVGMTDRINKFILYVIENGNGNFEGCHLDSPINIHNFSDNSDNSVYLSEGYRGLMTCPELLKSNEDLNKEYSILVIQNGVSHVIDGLDRVSLLLIAHSICNISPNHILDTVKYLHESKGFNIDFDKNVPVSFVRDSLNWIMKYDNLSNYISRNCKQDSLLARKLLSMSVEVGNVVSFEALNESLDIDDIIKSNSSEFDYCEDGICYIDHVLERGKNEGSKIDGIEKISLIIKLNSNKEKKNQNNLSEQSSSSGFVMKL